MATTLNDRLAWCSYCEDTYAEGLVLEHAHLEEIAAEAQFLGIKQKGPPTGECDDGPFYSRADAIRDGRPMRYLSKGKMRTTTTA